jgi:hypothetical protein
MESTWKVEGPAAAGGFDEMSEFTRLFGFRRPEAAMRDIVARPSAIIPLTLAILVAVAYMTVARPQLIWTRNESVLAIAGMAASVIARTLLIAALLTAFAAIISHARVRFREVFAVVCYSRMPGVVFTVLTIILILMRRASALSAGPSYNPIPTNLAVFLDPGGTPRFVYALAGSVDCVVFWELSLMALGLKAASRLSSAAANVGVAVFWALWALGYAAWVQLVAYR